MCEICSAIVKLSALSQHLKSHEKRFKCDHCDKRFAREKAFLAHKSNYHNEAVKVDAGKKPLLTCSFCSIKFEAPVQLEKHLRSHSKSKHFDVLRAVKVLSVKAIRVPTRESMREQP